MSVSNRPIITFESLDVEGSVFVCGYNHRPGIRVKFLYMKVIGSRARSQEQKTRKIPHQPCKTSMGNKSGSIEDRAVQFVCSVGFSAMSDRMVHVIT